MDSWMGLLWITSAPLLLHHPGHQGFRRNLVLRTRDYCDGTSTHSIRDFLPKWLLEFLNLPDQYHPEAREKCKSWDHTLYVIKSETLSMGHKLFKQSGEAVTHSNLKTRDLKSYILDLPYSLFMILTKLNWCHSPPDCTLKSFGKLLQQI